MSVIKRAGGYGGAEQILKFTHGDKILTDAIVQYHCESIIPMIARQQMVSTNDLLSNREVYVPMELDDECAADTNGGDELYSPGTDYNGPAENIQIQMGHRKFAVCQQINIEHKLDVIESERLLRTGGWDMYSQALSRKIEERLRRRSERYFWAVLLAESTPMPGGPYNVGTVAGMDALLLAIQQEMAKREIICSPNDPARGRFKVILPWCALGGMNELSKVCCENNFRANGVYITPYGFDVHLVHRLPTTGASTYGFWLDPSHVGFPHDWALMDWTRQRKEYWLDGVFVYDALVVNPAAVGSFLVTA